MIHTNRNLHPVDATRVHARVQAALGPVVSYLPEGRRDNETLAAEYPEWTAERLFQKTGIAERRLAAPDEFTSDLATKAAERLFELDPTARDRVDFVLLVTSTPDYLAPSTAVLVQHGLGLPQSVGSMDLLCACAGYTYGLYFAAGLVESGRARGVLVLTADRLRTFIDGSAFNIKALMGDAATACLVERAQPGPGTVSGVLRDSGFGTDGSGARKLCNRGGGTRGFSETEQHESSGRAVEMDGAAVFHFAVSVVPRHIDEMLGRNGLSLDDIDLFVFHQANRFLLDHLRRKLKIPADRFVYAIEETGNTSASTVPLGLERARLEGRLQPGTRVFLMGFGTGWSWSSMILEYPS